MLPVLCVHGLWDDARSFEPLRRHLLGAGWRRVEAMELKPNNGGAGLRLLAEQVRDAADRLLADTDAAELDVVGFSMGALVSRYWIQRLGGRERARRFISISGPHHGTLTAHLGWRPGAREMRPESPFLTDLGDEPAPWGKTRVYAFWTPFDLMIVPPSSSHLPGAVGRTFPVVLHPLMLSDRRVLGAVASALREPESPCPPPSTSSP